MTLERDDADERVARLEKLMREARGKTETETETVSEISDPKRPKPLAPVKVEGARLPARTRPRSKKR